MIYKPYTYLIGWSKLDTWYYGSETSCRRPANPDNLWKNYFTSSKHVKAFREKNGEPDVIEIRKVFETKDAARDWEHEILQRMKVVFNKRWLNRTDNRVYDRTGTLATEATKIKLKARIPWNKGIKRMDAGVAKMKVTKKGKNTGIDNPNYGKKWNKKQREKMSERLLIKNHMRGNVHTSNALAKMAEARKQYWQRQCIWAKLILTEE